MIKVSVIVAVYNNEKYLKKCIESIQKQTLTELEIILVNDGSDDKSPNICKEFAENDSRIKVINKQNEGVSKARNEGIKIATGKYIGFVDSDDWIECNMYKNMYEKLIQYDADICMGGYCKEVKGKTIDYKIPIEATCILKRDVGESVLQKLVGEKNIGEKSLESHRSTCTNLYRLNLIKEENIKFDEQLPIGEDFLFNIMIMKFSEKIIIDNNIYYHYMYRDNSAMNKYRERFYNEHKELIAKIHDTLDISNKHEYRSVYNNMCLNYCIYNIENECKLLNASSRADKINRIKLMKDNVILEYNLIQIIKNKNIKILKKINLILLKNKNNNIIYLFNKFIYKLRVFKIRIYK